MQFLTCVIERQQQFVTNLTWKKLKFTKHICTLLQINHINDPWKMLCAATGYYRTNCLISSVVISNFSLKIEWFDAQQQLQSDKILSLFLLCFQFYPFFRFTLYSIFDFMLLLSAFVLYFEFYYINDGRQIVILTHSQWFNIKTWKKIYFKAPNHFYSSTLYPMKCSKFRNV